MLTSNLVIVLFTPLLAGYVLVLIFVHRNGDAAQKAGQSVRFGWLRRSIAPGARRAGRAGTERGLLAARHSPSARLCRRQPVVRWPLRVSRAFCRVEPVFQPHVGLWRQHPCTDDAISFQIGAAVLAFAVLGIFFTWRMAGRLRWEIAYFVAGTWPAYVASTWAAPLWETPILGGLFRTHSSLALARRDHAVRECAGCADRPSSAPVRDRLSLPLLAVATTLILASYPYLRVEISKPVEAR